MRLEHIRLLWEEGRAERLAAFRSSCGRGCDGERGRMQVESRSDKSAQWRRGKSSATAGSRRKGRSSRRGRSRWRRRSFEAETRQNLQRGIAAEIVEELLRWS